MIGQGEFRGAARSPQLHEFGKLHHYESVLEEGQGTQRDTQTVCVRDEKGKQTIQSLSLCIVLLFVFHHDQT